MNPPCKLGVAEPGIVLELGQDPPVDRVQLDVEIVYGFRWRLALTADSPSYPGSDEKLWSRVGVHGEQGEETVEVMIQKVAGHDLAHVNQLQRALGR
jgi:hypothetical protein